jgi:hypothetical protein
MRLNALALHLNKHMTFKHIAHALACIALSGCPNLWAQDFDLGRFTLSLPGTQWKMLQETKQGLPMTNGQRQDVRLETKSFYMLDKDGIVQSMVLAEGTLNRIANSNEFMLYSQQCQPNETYYAEGETGVKLKNSQCLTAHSPSNTKALLTSIAPTLLEKFEAEKIPLPEKIVLISSLYQLSDATRVRIVALVTLDFLGLENTSTERYPEDVDPKHVAWAKDLMEEVLSGVQSFSKKIRIPIMGY